MTHNPPPAALRALALFLADDRFMVRAMRTGWRPIIGPDGTRYGASTRTRIAEHVILRTVQPC